MATIPSFEHVLLEIHQSLGLPQMNSQIKTKFAAHQGQVDTHVKKIVELLIGVFDALEMDPQAQIDAMTSIMEWGNFQSAIGQHTWTGNASAQQVTWHMLAYFFVPSLARRLAFWGLAGDERGQHIDEGMPGGEFWFLPTWDQEANKITLPVPQVLDWLLDLLELPTLGHLSAGLGNKNLREDDGNSSVVRTFQNWRTGTLPNFKKIDDVFPDDAHLTFHGTFVLDTGLTSAAQLQAALAFVECKGLNAATLHDQIPMTVARLEPVLNGIATDEENQEFVRLISLRYAQPTMLTIRQRLRVARMAQDGYTRLLAYLCGDGVAPTCTDPHRNKLLQLLALFDTIYNLTIEAWHYGITTEEEDAYFEAKLAPLDKVDLLISIVPSLRDENHATKLGECLTRKFLTLEANSPLEDLVALGGTDAAKDVILRRIHTVKNEIEEDLRTEKLVEQVQRSSPWRALQAESSYGVILQVAQHGGLSAKTRDMAVQRLRELAATPGKTVGAISLELAFLLNADPKQRTKDIAQRVENLLAEAQASPGYDEWKAPLLRWEGKHRLMQNDFAGAIKLLKAALEACKERGFGGLPGEIARDGWAIDIAENGLNAKNQEFWYSSMMRYGMFPEGLMSLEDAAVECEKFFWSDLYHPYPGVERQQMKSTEDWSAVCHALMGFSAKSDWDGLRAWLKRSASKYQRVRFVDARRDTVLLLWINIMHGINSKLPMAATPLPEAIGHDLAQLTSMLQGWHIVTKLLIEAWPQQARIADFKGQTPLMLVVNNGDVALTKLLAPLSDVDAQDSIGRTALHSAACGRSPECVAIVLERDPLVADKVTKDEKNTALHTAVRFGQPESVRRILDAFPGLAMQANVAGQTPLDMAKDIGENWVDWAQQMRQENRQTGSIQDFREIAQILANDSLSGCACAMDADEMAGSASN